MHLGITWNKNAIVNNLFLKHKSNNRVLSGQFIGQKNSMPAYFEENVVALHELTGKWISILTGEYGKGTDVWSPKGSRANA